MKKTCLLKSNRLKKSSVTAGISAAVVAQTLPPNRLKRYHYPNFYGRSTTIADALQIPQGLKDEFAALVSFKAGYENESMEGLTLPCADIYIFQYLLTFLGLNIEDFEDVPLKAFDGWNQHKS